MTLLFLFAATAAAVAAAPVARKYLTPAGFRSRTSRPSFCGAGAGAAAGVPPTPTGDTGSHENAGGQQ